MLGFFELLLGFGKLETLLVFLGKRAENNLLNVGEQVSFRDSETDIYQEHTVYITVETALGGYHAEMAWTCVEKTKMFDPHFLFTWNYISDHRFVYGVAKPGDLSLHKEY